MSRPPNSFCCLASALIGLCTLPASAQVFGGVSSTGTVVLSNFRGAETPAVVVAAEAKLKSSVEAMPYRDSTAVRLRAQAYRSIVREIAHQIEVPEQLLNAVIEVESSYLATAVSSKGAQGLMQLIPDTARRFGVANPFDPHDNVRGGALYLKWLLDLFGGDLQLALAGYNAGEQAVIRAGYRIPPFKETQQYVPRVMERLQRGIDS